MNLTPDTRLWVYRIIASLVPLLVTLGVTTEGVASQVLNVAAAILSVGGSLLAANNVK
jgi:uncharacterized membrane protein